MREGREGPTLMKYRFVLVFGLASMLSACGGGFSDFRNALAANWGVKEKKRTVKQKDLGKNYTALKGLISTSSTRKRLRSVD